MGDFVSAIFNPGGAAKDAAREQTRATEKAMAEYKKGIQEAKQEIAPREQEAKRERIQRTREALDLLQYGFSPSIDVMQQGNTAAQNTIIGGGNNAMAAILGGQLQQQQPQNINFSPADFLSGIGQQYDLSMPQVSQQPNVPSYLPTNNAGVDFRNQGNPFSPSPTAMGNGFDMGNLDSVRRIAAQYQQQPAATGGISGGSGSYFSPSGFLGGNLFNTPDNQFGGAFQAFKGF